MLLNVAQEMIALIGDHLWSGKGVSTGPRKSDIDTTNIRNFIVRK